MSAAVRPGGAVMIYGALSGPVLALNILDVFLEKQLQVLSFGCVQHLLHGLLHVKHATTREAQALASANTCWAELHSRHA